MRYNMYSVYDRVANEYAPPFYAKNVDVARRMFANSIREFAYSKDDYRMIEIGWFDSEYGKVDFTGWVDVTEPDGIELNPFAKVER